MSDLIELVVHGRLAKGARFPGARLRVEASSLRLDAPPIRTNDVPLRRVALIRWGSPVRLTFPVLEDAVHGQKPLTLSPAQAAE